MYTGHQQYTSTQMAGYPPPQQTGYGQPMQQSYGYNTTPAPQQHMQPQQGYGAAPSAGHAAPASGMAPGQSNSLHTGHFGPHHVYQYPTTFMFQDKTMYTGNFRGGTYVCNPDGSPAFSTRDAVLTIRNKEVVYDALNQPIACLHIKSISLHGTWQIFRGDSTSSSALIAEVKPSMMAIGGKKIKVTLAGKQEPEFVIQGNFLGKSFVYVDARNQTIAESKRHGKFSSAMNYLSGQDTFTLTVQPNIDTALLVLCTLVIDDILAGGKER